MIIYPTNHILLDFYGNDKSNYCYLPILKNGHSWCTQLFVKSCDFQLTSKISDKKYIIVLRDPFNRWISGVSQWFSLNVKEDSKYVISEDMLKLIFDAINLDGHTRPQIDYVIGLDFSKCIFFDLDNKLFEVQITKFIKNHLNKDFVMPEINTSINATVTDSFKNSIKQQLINVMKKDSTLVDKVRNFYYNDYDLRSMCKFN